MCCFETLSHNRSSANFRIVSWASHASQYAASSGPEAHERPLFISQNSEKSSDATRPKCARPHGARPLGTATTPTVRRKYAGPSTSLSIGNWLRRKFFFFWSDGHTGAPRAPAQRPCTHTAQRACVRPLAAPHTRNFDS